MLIEHKQEKAKILKGLSEDCLLNVNNNPKIFSSEQTVTTNRSHHFKLKKGRKGGKTEVIPVTCVTTTGPFIMGLSRNLMILDLNLLNLHQSWIH